jgi:hypothetical protein
VHRWLKQSITQVVPIVDISQQGQESEIIVMKPDQQTGPVEDQAEQ